MIDYDLRRYSSSQVTDFREAPPVLEKSPVMQVYGASKMSITSGEPTSNIDKRALREWLRGLRRGIFGAAPHHCSMASRGNAIFFAVKKRRWPILLRNVTRNLLPPLTPATVLALLGRAL